MEDFLLDVSVGISPYRSSTPIGFFLRPKGLEKMLNRASIPTRSRFCGSSGSHSLRSCLPGRNRTDIASFGGQYSIH